MAGEKKKTKAKQRTRDPAYYETISFVLELPESHELVSCCKALNVLIYHKIFNFPTN